MSILDSMSEHFTPRRTSDPWIILFDDLPIEPLPRAGDVALSIICNKQTQ